jgi:enterochelin esterase-like enzyme
MTAKAVAAAVALLVLAGLHGAWSYAHDFYLYRGFPRPHDPTGVPAGRLEKISFYSPALQGQHDYYVYLPPRYASEAAAGERFPVVYLLHGAPGWPQRFTDAGDLGVRIDTLLAQHRIRPFLVVMPDGRNGTYSADTEWADTASGRYESYVLDTVHAVDRRWATLPDRRDRAIAGNSAGGYGAANIALRHLGTFGLFQSWSGYFLQTPTGPFKDASAAALQANSPDDYVSRLRAQIGREPLDAVLYGGSQDPDTRQLPGFALRLREAGAHVETMVRPGRHDWGLWRAMMPAMLRWLSARFGAP